MADSLADLWPFLRPEERARLTQLLARTRPVWSPGTNIKQQMVLDSTADVIGFGGAAGGGKTDVAIGKALLQHQRVAFFRREATQLTAVIDRLAELLGGRDGYNGQDRIWREAGPRKVQIEFGSTPHPGDETRYQGRPKDLLIVDEAANFLESQVRFLMGWVRTTDLQQRCQTLMTFNPPTEPEGQWIIRYFAPWLDKKHPRPAMPGELRWFAVIDGKDVEVADGSLFSHNGEPIRPHSRTFIPSRIVDNVFLMGTNYYSQLQALPEPLRSQMLYGDFEIGLQDHPFQIIPTEWVDIAMARWKKPDKLPPMDALGVDVARGGKDRTVIFRRHGKWFDQPLTYPGKATPDGPEVAALCIAAARDRAPIHIDVIGVGASPYDFLRQADQQVVGVNVAIGSIGADRSGMLSFADLRTELWWKMREALEPLANNGIALPPLPELRAELTIPRWTMAGRTIKLESVDEIKVNLGRSPDLASALVLANIETPRWFPSQRPGSQENTRRAAVDFDPRDF